ncbi:hypothetical protein RF11_00865 [Thelohanellus kitauei]|uniref:Uncharacterized protein n=1 Tax=Thelohanellus kitauei TaxID=669202 RepID=A0A0C2JWT6_THEKT|nr:hypothetical protein RF11_00865 [Thelohanellus kitauei]
MLTVIFKINSQEPTLEELLESCVAQAQKENKEQIQGDTILPIGDDLTVHHQDDISDDRGMESSDDEILRPELIDLDAQNQKKTRSRTRAEEFLRSLFGRSDDLLSPDNPPTNSGESLLKQIIEGYGNGGLAETAVGTQQESSDNSDTKQIIEGYGNGGLAETAVGTQQESSDNSDTVCKLIISN